MTETQVTRKCNKCNLDKRTTVHIDEEALYFCEEDLKKAGRMALMNPLADLEQKQPNPLKGAAIVIVIFIIGLAFGILVF